MNESIFSVLFIKKHLSAYSKLFVGLIYLFFSLGGVLRNENDYQQDFVIWIINLDRLTIMVLIFSGAILYLTSGIILLFNLHMKKKFFVLSNYLFYFGFILTNPVFILLLITGWPTELLLWLLIGLIPLLVHLFYYSVLLSEPKLTTF